MKVAWTVGDAAWGSRGQQITEIPDHEILVCATLEDAATLINEYIQSDFEARIGWEMWNPKRVDAAVKKLRGEK